MKRSGLFVFFAALFFIPSALQAQLAIYGTGTGATFSSATENLGYGGTAGIYKQKEHVGGLVAWGLDLRGTFVGRNDFHYYTGAIGPRLAFKPHIIPLDPYVEGLIGVASYNSGNGTNSTTHLNYQVVAGLDFTILPHLDWRVVDAAYSGVSGQSISAFTFSTGIVIRLW